MTAPVNLDSRKSKKVLRQEFRHTRARAERESPSKNRLWVGMELLVGLWVPSVVNVCSNFNTHF